MMEVDEVGGARILVDSGVGWLVGRVLDGICDWVGNQNQGGTPRGTDAMGSVW